MNCDMMSLDAEHGRFKAWLSTQGKETSNSCARCSLHGKRDCSVSSIQKGHVIYECYHCALKEFRELEATNSEGVLN